MKQQKPKQTREQVLSEIDSSINKFEEKVESDLTVSTLVFEFGNLLNSLKTILNGYFSNKYKQ